MRRPCYNISSKRKTAFAVCEVLMNKRTFQKTFSLLSVLILFVLAVTLLSACQKEKYTDLSAYRIVYAGDLSSSVFKVRVEDFAGDVNQALGTELACTTDRASEAQYEILVGDTGRMESIDAVNKIKGDGYAICKSGDKIVIVGTTRVLTMMALDAFREICLSATADAVPVPKSNVVSHMEMVDVDQSYVIVYSSKLDNKRGNDYDNSVTIAANPNAYDYPVQAAYDLRANLASALKADAMKIKFAEDSVAELSKEIVVGKTNRQVTAALFSQLDADTYGVRIQDGKIAVTGTNDAGVRAAVSLFKMLVDVSKATNDEGETVARLPADLSWIATRNAGWYTDFPRPTGEGISLSHTRDVEDGAVAYYYTGSGVGAASYDAYVSELKAAGYTVREENQIGESRFATMVNDKAVLYVAFQAFEHAEEQGVHLYVPTLRVISALLKNVNLIDEKELSPDGSYTKVTESKITTVRLSYKSDHSVYGNSYIFTLEDGSMVVYDSGMNIGSDTYRFYNVLRDLHRQSFGELPTSTHPLTVAAWILSHGHGDHYGNFLNLCENYGGQIAVEKLLTNFTSDEEDFNAYNPNNKIRDQLNSIQRLTKSGMTYIKLHTGQKFYLRNMEIEVLYTHEDLGEVRYTYFNDSTTVFRTTFHSTDGNGNRQGVPTSALWLGDLYQNGSKCLRAMYGSYLKSDMVQLAHHGYQGCELALYRLVAPTCVWWPSSLEFFHVATDASSSYWPFGINAAVANGLPSVKYIIIQDGYNTTVTITKDGADYRLQSESETGLYNAGITAAGNQENDYTPIVKYGGCIIKR